MHITSASRKDKISSLTEKLAAYKQNLIDFAIAHPRVTAILGSVGISFALAYVGRTTIDGILEPAYALEPTPCGACAKEFAPGQEAALFEGGSAKEFAPGQEAKIIGPELPDQGASEFAPGHQKKVIGDPGGDFGE